MYVPNYIPEPLEVPGNVTLRPYLERVQFIRKVTFLHAITLAMAGGIGCVTRVHVDILQLAVGLASILILLDLIRIFLRGKDIEASLTTGFLPIVVVLFGWLARDLSDLGWPTWPLLFSEASVVLYTLLCGRDYSFVGCFFLSLIFSSVGIAAISVYLHLSSPIASRALILSFAFLSYTVYDLASLLARRRGKESLAAVTDLYRDVFNFFGYFYRCIEHWKRHRIWLTPK